eukprot:scaffold109803_cov32-Tisochrysis_lutea.AAC.3
MEDLSLQPPWPTPRCRCCASHVVEPPTPIPTLAASLAISGALKLTTGWCGADLPPAYMPRTISSRPFRTIMYLQVSYPCDENAVEASQQLAGNLFSAMLVPLCQRASDIDLSAGSFDVRGDTVVLMTLVALTAAAFSNFDTPLARSLLDAGESASAEA